MAKDRIQMIGSEADTTPGSPNDMRQSAFRGGTVQFTGSEAELSKRTTPMGEFDKHVRGGRLEMIGSGAECNRTPRRGWDSYETPLSQNSEEETNRVSGYPTKLVG
jgi:hypothetical protein